MKLALAYLSGAREPYAEEAQAVFAKKIGHFLPFEILPIKAKSAARDQAEAKRRAESELILGKVAPDDFLWLFDEKGRQCKDSKDYSAHLVRAIESGKKRTLMVIGGPYGFTPELKARAQLLVSLSSLTFNHPVARIVALEQTYRALCIWKNLPYHNE